MTDSAEILVVEDHADLRDMLVVLLESEGFAVRTAVNGAEALKRLEETRPSLILLDLMMPVMDGREFRHAQLNDPQLAAIPTVLITAHADPVLLGDLSQDLALPVLQKPVDSRVLLAVVESALR